MITSRDLSILPYTPAYRQGCVDVFASNIPKFFTLDEVDQFNEWLDYLEGTLDLYPEEENCYYVVLLKGQVLACGGFGYNPSTNKAVLAWGLVHNSYHRQGIGSILLFHRLGRIGELYPSAVLLLDTTQHSYGFFERHGFVIEKITKDFYAQGMDRYDMKWQKK
jgi:ribosomal protein S18 acetylase RimI-like enzyme